jgi:hypothetical protein
MKKRLIYCAIAVLLSVNACKIDNENEVMSSNSDCLNKTVNDSVRVADVKSKIYGEWQLKQLIANIPNPKVPDLKVVFKDVLGVPIDKQVADVYENSKLKATMLYSLKQISNNNYQTVEIVSDLESFPNGEYNFLRGTVRACENNLMIDNGIAFDAPGYVFEKIIIKK